MTATLAELIDYLIVTKACELWSAVLCAAVCTVHAGCKPVGAFVANCCDGRTGECCTGTCIEPDYPAETSSWARIAFAPGFVCAYLAMLEHKMVGSS